MGRAAKGQGGSEKLALREHQAIRILSPRQLVEVMDRG